MPLAPEVEAQLEPVLDLYRQAQAELLDEIVAAASDLSRTSAAYRSRLAGLLRAVEEEMRRLDQAARDWTTTTLPTVYQLGADGAATSIGERFSWTQLHRRAVEHLAADTYEDLLGATRFVRRDTKAFIRYAARQRAAAVLTQGETAARAGRQLARRLEDRGIAAVTYRNGARHSLRDYADTVLRTKTAEAYNAGTLMTGAQFGVQWVQVSDGPSCGWTSHHDSDLASGSVRTLEEADAYPVSHPRCARSFGLLPVATKEEAERLAAGDYSGLRPVEAKPVAASHQKRLDAREARLEARAAKVR